MISHLQVFANCPTGNWFTGHKYTDQLPVIDFFIQETGLNFRLEVLFDESKKNYDKCLIQSLREVKGAGLHLEMCLIQSSSNPEIKL